MRARSCFKRRRINPINLTGFEYA
ncbi:protein of unknown function [Streptomyces murinus]